MSAEILNLSAYDLAEKIRDGSFSVVDVIRTHIQRIEEVNPSLNALIEDNFANAIAEAEKKDKELSLLRQSGNSTLNKLKSEKPLYGVPFTVKEMLAVENFKSTAGSIHHKESIPGFTSPLVQRILDQGGILLGTTNVPELGFWFETSNSVYGRTNNPYDKTRTSGGSSGGEAALIGAGASPFGLGSDIGGSIRVPAFFCGVFGHKPSSKALPLTGHFPYTTDEMKSLVASMYPFTTLGFLSRKATDLYPLLESSYGSDGIDPETKPKGWLKPRLQSFNGIKVYTLADPHIHLVRPTDLELRNTVTQSARYLEQLGAEIHSFPADFFKNAAMIWFAAIQSTKMGSFETKLSHGQGLNLFAELSKLVFKKSNYTLPSLLTVVAERLGGASKNKNAEKLLEELETMRSRLSDLLGQDGILLLPPHSRGAPKHSQVLMTPFDFVQCGIFTVLNMPATSIPTGLNEEGIPLGVQAVASPFCDHLCLSAAEELEKAFGGWTFRTI